MADIKRMSIKEFREFGYLQELNRHFLHPLGLALEVIKHSDGTEELGGIWDYRDDLEGIVFVDGLIDPSKAKFIYEEMISRQSTRLAVLGYAIQPAEKGGDIF